MTTAPTEPIDPGALIRSRGYIALLVLAAVVGIIVSLAGWVFLEVETWLQHAVYEDLPAALGFSSARSGGRSRRWSWRGSWSGSRSSGCRGAAGTTRPAASRAA